MEVYILLDILRDKKPLNFAVYIGSAVIITYHDYKKSLR